MKKPHVHTLNTKVGGAEHLHGCRASTELQGAVLINIDIREGVRSTHAGAVHCDHLTLKKAQVGDGG